VNSTRDATSFDDPLLTVGEIADLLRVHHTTVYRLAKRGQIPGFKVGSDWRFSKRQILKWLAKRQKEVE
jgi:excisionase family DNA binding protein